MTNIIEKAERVILSCKTQPQLEHARRYAALAVQASGLPLAGMVVSGAIDLMEVRLSDHPNLAAARDTKGEAC